jgi:pyruvate,water dikinase
MTVTAAGAREVEWVPPGPGTWRRELQHFPTVPTAHLREMFPALVEGFASSSERFGWLFETIALETVNDVLYTGIVPLSPGDFPTRFERAEQVFATKAWRADVDRWDLETKPATIRKHRTISDIDPFKLADDDLAAHIGRCHRHHFEMWRQHHVFNGAHWIPVGDFVTSAVEWTGMSPSKVAVLLRGASPISRGHCPEAEAVARAIESSPAALAIVHRSEGDPADVVDALVDAGGPVGDAMRDWLSIVGHRLIEGFDICFPTALERPALLLAAVRAALADEPHADDDEALCEVRDAVPDEHRNDFDDRYAEARNALHVRDERGIFSDAIAAGLVRRAWRAAGDRLALHGVLSDPALAVDATGDELREALLEPGNAALEDTLASRAAIRAEGADDPPAVIGSDDGVAPSFDGLPPSVARMMKAVVGLPDGFGRAEPEPDQHTVLAGIGASPGTHRGIARIVRTPDDLDRLDDGSVMVTITTGEAFNVAISLVSALVTEVGGVLSHAGITAREFRIPAVVSVTDATRRIPEGAVVEVDGDTGMVRLIS